MLLTILASANPLQIEVGLIFWTALAFLILLFLLGKFAWKPMVSALEEREQTIEESITRAERALEEARQLQADNEAARRQAESEAREVLRQAREQAEAVRAEEADKTRAEIEQMRDLARAEINREKTQALSELRSEVATLAIDAAEKILREDIDEDRQRRLVDQFIAELPTNGS